ncbi:MAG: GNAT family N-acetyltransferase [Bacteroides sp.]|nr:GNAT family N-acetyltransferase [Bacteroides sp.]
MQSKVKRLWQLCFDDSEAFTDLYFRMRYTEEVNIALCEGEEVVAALQMLPYPMTFCGGELRTAYVSGACTHPDYRNRGLMRRLLTQAFVEMRSKGVEVTTLIPAEPWLFDYYAQSGYAAVFCKGEEVFRAGGVTGEPLPLERADAYREDVYRYLADKQHERPCSLLHTEEDFKVVLADLALSGGHVYLLRRMGAIVALAVAYPSDASAEGGQQWHLEEVLADSTAFRTCLLQQLCCELRVPSLSVSVPDPEGAPLGMARIIHAPAVLQRYAAAHPRLTASFRLVDEQLPANDGYYCLHDGQCTTPSSPASTDVPTLNIAQLTERLFGPLHPYMCLMMN